MSFLDSREALAPQGIGKSVPRREDIRLLTGRGRYAADFSLPGQVHACILRSPHAHATIVGIDAAAALAAPGVLAVLTGGDAAEDGLRPIPHSPVPTNPHEVPLKSRDGSEFFLAPHPVLASDAVRYVGEPVAIVVAETPSQAMDAAELVEVTYGPLPSVTRSRRGARIRRTGRLWPQHGSNLCVDSEAGDKAATDAAFARAAHVVRLETAINRVTGVPMELRAAVGAYDAARGAVHRLHQRRRRRDPAARRHRGGAWRREGRGAGRLRRCRRKFRHPQQHLSGIRAGRVGGKTGRPAGQMGLRPQRRVSRRFSRPRPDLAKPSSLSTGTAASWRWAATNISNLGASAISFVPLAKGIAVSSSVYSIPVSYMRGVAVVTNTTPSSAYRSAGRPEVVFVLERLIDIACRRHGFDRLDLRLRNLVPHEAMPYRNPLGLVYDSGDYPASLRRAAELGDWAGFAARRAEAQRRGRCRGIGIAASIELNTGAPRERAELTIDPSGTVELVLGTMSAGQGHETSFAQVVGEWLGVDPERVRLVTGDTDRVQAGGGSASARSMRLGSWVTPRPPTRSSRKAGGSPPPCSRPPKPISNSSGGVSS